jgi:hypothetical protein
MFDRLLGWTLGFIVFGIIYITLDAIIPHDDTDYPHERSGLRLLIDAKTGCQYLSTFFGGPVPRVDANGRHICIRPQ